MDECHYLIIVFYIFGLLVRTMNACLHNDCFYLLNGLLRQVIEWFHHSTRQRIHQPPSISLFPWIYFNNEINWINSINWIIGWVMAAGHPKNGNNYWIKSKMKVIAEMHWDMRQRRITHFIYNEMQERNWLKCFQQ